MEKPIWSWWSVPTRLDSFSWEFPLLPMFLHITQQYTVYRKLKFTKKTQSSIFINFHQLAVCQNLVPLVNIKIAGKWMFIPLKMVLIGIDPYPTEIHRCHICQTLWMPFLPGLPRPRCGTASLAWLMRSSSPGFSAARRSGAFLQGAWTWLQ